MKIQTLAVIFVIIMLPISLVLSVYTQNQMTTLNLQSKYDSRLIDSTYEAIKTFQINTLANSSSDVASSKIRDIEASVNSFFSSVANNFGLSEYNADTIKEYMPAIVYTLYDGYYIYSPYTNNINNINVKEDSSYQNKQTLQGLKPYVYYSCRYKVGSNSDFVITYSLDSYITIQGTINGVGVNKSGYLLDNIIINGNTITISEGTMENTDEAMSLFTSSNGKYSDEKYIYKQKIDLEKMTHINNIDEDYLNYLDSIDKNLIDGISYTRLSVMGINLLVKGKNTKMVSFGTSLNSVMTIPKSFDEENNYLKNNYDLLYGKFPKEATDVLLVISSDNEVSERVLENLGLDVNQDKFSFEDVLNKELVYVINDNLYYYLKV